MHPDQPAGLLHRGSNLRDRQRGCVAREQRSGRRGTLDFGEQPLLDRQILNDGLDDDIGVGDRVPDGRLGLQSLPHRRRVCLSQFAPFHTAGEQSLDFGFCLR